MSILGGLGGALSGVLGGGDNGAGGNGAGDNGKGLGGGSILPSLSTLPGLPTLPGIPPLFPPGSSASAASQSASASAQASNSASLSTSASGSSIPLSSPPASSTTSVASTSTSLTAAPPDVTTGQDGIVHTVSHVVTVTPSSTTSATPVHKTSFLQNKALSGTVFGLAGLLALVLLVGLATFAVRRRKRSRLLDDAVSFDPGLLAAADRYDGSEKGHSTHGSISSGPAGPAYGNYPAPPVPHPEYYGASQNSQRPEYYGGPQSAQQPYYSAYVPPMSVADSSPPSTLAAAAPSGYTTSASHAIPRVPVPQPLPAEFGSSQSSRRSIEETEFWSRTLKVANE